MSAGCPADRLRPAGERCGSPVDQCEIPAACTGTSATCPANLARTGCEATTCAFERPLACHGEAIPRSLGRLFERARTLVGTWAETCATSPGRRLLKKAATRLRKADRRVAKARARGRLSSACGDALHETIANALARTRGALAR